MNSSSNSTELEAGVRVWVLARNGMVALGLLALLLM